MRDAPLFGAIPTPFDRQGGALAVIRGFTDRAGFAWRFFLQPDLKPKAHRLIDRPVGL